MIMIRNKIKRIYQIFNNSYLTFRYVIWYLFINEFIFDFYQLEGESMIPTFQPAGDIVVVDKLSKWMYKKDYRKGEIICVLNPVNNSIYLCKRITHLEGELITFKNNNEYIVPNNHVWVEGDNKDNSYDSRSFGAIPKQLIVGRVPVQIWPRFTLFRNRNIDNKLI